MRHARIYNFSELTTVNGCDSVAILNLTINQPDTSITNVTVCESYEWNGETYTESGTYEYLEQNNNELSMSFDGLDDYVDVNNINSVGPTTSSDFSFSLWINPSNTGTIIKPL